MNVNFTGAVVPNIVEDEVVVAAFKSLAQNKRISALCFEQHEKGLFPDYAAIKARVLQEDESLPIDKIASKNMVLQQCLCLHIVLHHIIHPLYNCKISATPVYHCERI